MILIKTQTHKNGVWQYIRPVGWATYRNTLIVVGYRWDSKLRRFNSMLVKYYLINYRIVGVDEADLPFGLSPVWAARRERKRRQRERERERQ